MPASLLFIDIWSRFLNSYLENLSFDLLKFSLHLLQIENSTCAKQYTLHILDVHLSILFGYEQLLVIDRR